MQLWTLPVTYTYATESRLHAGTSVAGAQQWRWASAHMTAGKAAKVQSQPCLGQGGRLHDLPEVLQTLFAALRHAHAQLYCHL